MHRIWSNKSCRGFLHDLNVDASVIESGYYAYKSEKNVQNHRNFHQLPTLALGESDMPDVMAEVDLLPLLSDANRCNAFPRLQMPQNRLQMLQTTMVWKPGKEGVLIFCLFFYGFVFTYNTHTRSFKVMR